MGGVIHGYSDIQGFRISILKAIKFISNLYFSTQESYFGTKLSENPLLHTWSLSIEMQFYILLPFVIYFFRKHLLSIFILSIASITLYSSYEIYALENQRNIYFSFMSRVPEFLIGCLYAVILKKGLNFSRQKNNVIALISFLILIGCAFIYSEATPFPGALAIIPCFAGANLLVIKNNFLSDFFSKKPLVYVGELSYSLYLWHWGIMALMRYANQSYYFSLLEIVFVIISTFAMAWLSYNLLESRFRKTEKMKFAIIFAPIFVGIYVLSASMNHIVAKILGNRKLPDIYVKPFFGLKSHTQNIVEKYGDKSKNDKIFLMGIAMLWY